MSRRRQQAGRTLDCAVPTASAQVARAVILDCNPSRREPGGADGPPARLEKLRLTPSIGFGELVERIERVFGVKVAARPKSKRTAQPASADEALAIARRVGLVTKNGKLSKIFR